MSKEFDKKPDIDSILKSLKDFQRDTVEYIFRRLYLDDDRVSRMLIADEVGLGKTFIARGLIAKAVDYLWDQGDRIDIVYICANLEIAQQNIDRLNITHDEGVKHASRATLLPLSIEGLNERSLNFISLTPGTSFRLYSTGGTAEERRLLYYLLLAIRGNENEALSLILCGPDKTKQIWDQELLSFDPASISSDLQQAFLDALKEKPDILRSLDELIKQVKHNSGRLKTEYRSWCFNLIGQLRELLARSNLSALEPDLVILDEFQRFKYLLENNKFANLARTLYSYKKAKVLLLSATPYKMYTIYGEEDEDHYQDFARTVDFLLEESEEQNLILKKALTRFRKSFLVYGLGNEGQQAILSAKRDIENVLRRVMVRTERISVSQDSNCMLKEIYTANEQMEAKDFASYVFLDRISQTLNAGDQIEYWKSSAYPINMMEDYKLKRQFSTALQSDIAYPLVNILEQAKSYLLKWEDIRTYNEIDLGNARLRALATQSLASKNWKLLWLPASLPYYHPQGTYGDVQTFGLTKALIFSAWRVVPKMIALMLSYVAEQQMLAVGVRDYTYDALTSRARLLDFNMNDDRPGGMSIFTLIYPSIYLAKHFDPLRTSKEISLDGLTSLLYLFERTRIYLGRRLEQAIAGLPRRESGPPDERWYWAAPLLLDRYFENSAISNWLYTQDRNLAWETMLDKDPDSQSRFVQHVRAFIRFFRNPEPLGPFPEKLYEVLAMIALAGPATTVLRALLRVTKPEEIDSKVLASAARVGLGFRTLFNQPETITMLQSIYDKQVYWKSILQYGLDGNLQSVLDEYVHILRESLGLVGHDPSSSAERISNHMQTALSLRAPSIRFDEIQVVDSQIVRESHGVRCRYAQRFGDESSTIREGGSRDSEVRIAFNSPFRPFVLATTSLGQEGLDFHMYCHRVVHWNLPSNPIDLEQREGRVNRYKGHVIRRNIASHYGMKAIIQKDGELVDPWDQLFTRAVSDRRKGDNDLIPYWIYEQGDYAIERVIPLLPLSREVGRLHYLKKSLVAYRSVIGQARQQELLTVLTDRLDPDKLQQFAKEFSIDLRPPTNSRTDSAAIQK